MRVSKGYPVSALPPQCLKLNPQLSRKPAICADAETASAAPRMPQDAFFGQKRAKSAAKAKMPRSESPIETKFALLWGTVAPDLRLVREHRFAPPRRWKADFAHLPSRTLIECEGLGGGRHQRTGGFIADAEKYLEATLLSWTVVRLTAPQINAPTLTRIAAWIRARKNA